MKNETRVRPDTRHSQAVSWLARLITADDISAEWPGFKAWLGKSPHNRAEFNQVEALWRARRASVGSDPTTKGVKAKAFPVSLGLNSWP